MAGMLKRLKKSKMMSGGLSHKERRKNIRKSSKEYLKLNKKMANKRVKSKKFIKKFTNDNEVNNTNQHSKRTIAKITPLERLKRQNQADEKEIRMLEKNLRIKRDKPTPSVFYSEGVGDIIDLCNSIMKDPTTGKPIDFLDDNYIEKNNSYDDCLESFEPKNKLSTNEEHVDDSDDEGFYKKLRQISQDIIENSDDDDESKYNDIEMEITSISSVDYNKDEDKLINDESMKSLISTDINEFHDISSYKQFSNDIPTSTETDNDNESGCIGNESDNESNFSNTDRDETILSDDKNLYGDGSISKGENALKKLQEIEDSEERILLLNRLSRQFTSILNRVSQSNHATCISQLESVFQTHPRNDCCVKLSEGILSFCIQPKITHDSIMLSMTIIVQALTYKIGPELVVTLLQKLCRMFEDNFNASNGDDTKFIQNCMILFTLLYRFNMIQIQLIDDLVIKILDRCLEQDIEILLLSLKYCGLHLKKENHTLLKKWVQNLNEKSKKNSEWLMTNRVNYMLETINILVSSKTKKECLQEYNNELLDNYLSISKSLLKTNKTHANRYDAINFTYSQLLNADPSGKWWLVGSAFSAPSVENIPLHVNGQKNGTTSNFKWDSKLIEVAKQHRMNTLLKQNIFCTLMTSNGVEDAFVRLTKLNLTGKETGDISFVIVYCCLQEQKFNLFYPTLILELTKHHRTFRTSFQFALWDKIRTIDNDSSKLFLTNLKSLLIQLLLNEAITLKVFKIVTFQDISACQLNFFKMLFNQILQLSISSLKKIFDIFGNSNQYSELSSGLKYFLLRYLSADTTCQINSNESKSTQKKIVSDKIKMVCNFIDGYEPSNIDL